MELRTLSLNAMLSDMEPLLRRMTGDGIDLAYVQAAGLWRIAAPPGRLEELLLALVIDACEAMAEKGGTLRVATGNVRMPQGLPSHDAVTLTVSDTARTVGTTFQVALRGHGRREGLGLRLGYELAELTGGRLDLEAQSAGGVAVRILIPRVATAEPEPAPESRPASENATQTILVVEDDKAAMMATNRVLTRLGYGVLRATSAEAALKLLETHTGDVDLLLTDILLPDKDGVTLAREVRNKRPGIRVLYMSGYSEEAMNMQGLADPGVKLLEKPFTVQSLTTSVRNALA